jgi:glycosyltransferase involved in cell wall biosynthesis
MANKFLTALPVYNEVTHVAPVLDQVLHYSPHVLVVDDGSTDGTSELLSRRSDIQVVRHPQNRGYGAGLKTAFEYTLAHGVDTLVTIDCDGQHQPHLIPDFVAASATADLVSGSRYLARFPGDSVPPADRRRINAEITAEVNRKLGLNLTDAFCGFKAYSAGAIAHFDVHELGYAMPIELWVQAVRAKLKIVEMPVPLIYLEEERSFGGSLDNAAIRLDYYRLVLERSMAAAAGNCPVRCGD